MSDQYKPIGEWTVETVSRLMPGLQGALACRAIADAHNAALAAAKSGGWLSEEALDEYARVEQEHRTLVDALTTIRRTTLPLQTIVDSTLAKVKAYPLSTGRTK